jgi:hypothetical protein
MKPKKIIGFSVAAALVLLVLPISASAAPEPAAPTFSEPRSINACLNADDLDGDLVDNGDPDTTDFALTVGGALVAKGFNDTTATSVDLFEVPPSAPPIFLGTDVAVSDGDWSITMTVAQSSEGHHLLQAFANNSLGVMRSLAGARVFCVDTVAPAPPVILSPLADLNPGVFPPLGTCITNPFTLSGTAESFGNVVVEQQPAGAIFGSSTWTTVADRSGSWSIDASHTTLAGNHTVTIVARQRDGGRNVSPDSAATTFDICDDKTPPSAPVIVTPSDGGLPSPAVMVISGTFSLGQGVTRVVVREFGVSPDFFADFEATIDTLTGDWTLTQTFTSSGIVTMNAFAIDAAGNVSPLSNTVRHMVDTDAPEARINLPSGFLLGDLWILTSPQFFSGTAKDNYGLDHVEIVYEPLLLGAAESTNPAACADSDGACPTDFDDVADPNDTFEVPQATWSDAPALTLGLYEMQVVAVDLAGNRSEPSSMFVLIVDLP